MYLIIKPIKQEECIIDIYIYYFEFHGPVYHRVFETEQEIYVVNDWNGIIYLIAYEFKFCRREIAENLIPEEINSVFEFNYDTKEIRIIK